MRPESQAVSLNLGLKGWLGIVFLVAGLLTLRVWDISKESEKALLGANAELARILSVMGNFKGLDLKVVLDGTERALDSTLPYARKYLQTHYRGEAAETWIKKHLYRSPVRDEVIYLKYPDGSRKLLRDVFLEELSRP